MQDARQEQLTLPDTDTQEHEKLVHLAKLYSLSMHVENGSAILTKTRLVVFFYFVLSNLLAYPIISLIYWVGFLLIIIISLTD